MLEKEQPQKKERAALLLYIPPSPPPEMMDHHSKTQVPSDAGFVFPKENPCETHLLQLSSSPIYRFPSFPTLTWHYCQVPGSSWEANIITTCLAFGFCKLLREMFTEACHRTSGEQMPVLHQHSSLNNQISSTWIVNVHGLPGNQLQLPRGLWRPPWWTRRRNIMDAWQERERKRPDEVESTTGEFSLFWQNDPQSEKFLMLKVKVLETKVEPLHEHCWPGVTGELRTPTQRMAIHITEIHLVPPETAGPDTPPSPPLRNSHSQPAPIGNKITLKWQRKR